MVGSAALVSVLLPFRDAAATIEAAVADILAQQDVELELIAIDDGSEDDSAARVAAFRDPRVRISSAAGGGLARALELGRREARGAWIARMDADDRCSHRRLATQLAALEAAPRVAAIGCRVRAFPEDIVGEGLRAYIDWQNSLLTPGEHRRDLFVEAPLCHPSVLLRRDAIAAVGGWREEGWPEDYALWLRLSAAGWDLAKVDEELFSWRHSGGRATFSDPRYALDRFRALRATFLAPALAGRPLSIWGAGRTGKRLARELERHGVRAARFVDIDPAKVGRRARGAPVVGPDAIAPTDGVLVVAVGARGARAIVRARLEARGFVEGTDFICAA